jgi:hypothetical protein
VSQRSFYGLLAGVVLMGGWWALVALFGGSAVASNPQKARPAIDAVAETAASLYAVQNEWPSAAQLAAATDVTVVDGSTAVAEAGVVSVWTDGWAWAAAASVDGRACWVSTAAAPPILISTPTGGCRGDSFAG